MTKKLTSPEHMTRASQGGRAAFDALVGSIPYVGSALQTLLAHAYPSKRDAQVAAWHDEATDVLNDHTAKIDQSMLDLSDISGRVDVVEEIVEGHLRTGFGLSSSVPSPPAATQFDGELANYRELVESGDVRTAMTLLEKRFGTAELQKGFPTQIVAQAISLMGICARDLGDEPRAAALFREAYARDPGNAKLRSNAIVGFLMEGAIDEAIQLAAEASGDLPDDARIAANLIYASMAAGQAIDPDKDLDPSVRFAEEVLLAHVASLRANEDHGWIDEALRVAVRYPESEAAKRLAAEATITSAIKAWDHAEERPPSDILDRAARAAETLAGQWEKRRVSQRKLNSSDHALLNNALVGFRLSGAAQRGLAMVEANLAIFDEARETRALAGVIALEAGRHDLLDRLLTVPFEGDALLRVERALQNTDLDQALACVLKNQEEADAPGWVDLTVLQHCLQGALRTDHVDRTSEFDAALKAASGDVRHLTTVARFARKLDMTEMSDAAFHAARAIADKAAFEDRMNLSAEARARRDHLAVIELLEPVVNPTRASEERAMLAQAFASSEPPLARGVDFFNAARKAGPFDAEVERSEGFFHLSRRAPEKAVPRFRNVLSSHAQDLRVILALWQSLETSGRHEDARTLIVGTNPGDVEGSDEDKMALAQILWRYGDAAALDFAYEVAAGARDNSYVCLKYTGFFLLEPGSENRPRVKEPEQVALGTWARVLRDDGEAFEFLVAEEGDSARGRFTTANPIVAAAIGKRVGERFSVSTPREDQEWSVAEIRSRHLLLCHEIMATFQKHFPENDGLYSVSVKDGDLSQVLAVIRQRRERADALAKAYQEKRLPLGVVAALGSMTSIEVAIGMAQSGAHIVNASGAEDEERHEAAIARRERRRGGVVVDAYTAWFLAEEDLLPLAKETAGRLVVPRSVLDEIEEVIARLAPGDEPRMVVHYEAGQYFRREIDPEDLRRQQDRLRLMTARLCEHGDIVGVEVGPQLDPKVFPVLGLVGGALDAAIVAQREGLPLLSADLHLRNVSRDMFSVSSFGLKGLFRLAQADGHIDRPQHSEIVLKMARHAHVHIPLNTDTLLDVLQADDTEGLQDFTTVARYLGTEGAEPISHMNVVSAFIDSLWAPIQTLVHDRSVTLLRRQKATGIVLEHIIRLRNVDLRSIVRRVFLGRAAGSPELQYLQGWLEGHFLMDEVVRKRHPTPHSDRDAGKHDLS